MTAAALERKPWTPPAPVGTGELHQALENAKERARLTRFLEGTGCAIQEVSADGIHFDLPLTLDAMRRRGYIVGDPQRPQTQLRKGHTTWYVSVEIPGRAVFALAICTPDTPRPSQPKKESHG